MLVSGQEVLALPAAQRAWATNQTFILGSRVLLNKEQFVVLSDGQDVVGRYSDWISAKWMGEGELTSERFDDPTVFFCSPAADASLFRLGTIRELEDKGLGVCNTERILSKDAWESESVANHNKVLLSILTRHNFFGANDRYDSSLFLLGLNPEEAEKFAQRALFYAAGDIIEDNHIPLIKTLLADGLDPFQGREVLGETPYDFAVSNEHADAVALFDAYRAGKDDK